MKNEDMQEFIRMLDFKLLKNGDIEIVPNRFTFAELPESIQKYLRYYFEYLELIK